MSYFARPDERPEWVARIPENWTGNWLKWSVDLSTKRSTKKEQDELPYIANEHIASWTGKLLIDNPKPVKADSRKFRENDVLFNKLGPHLAKVYHATFDGTSSGELLCLRPANAVHPRFLFYALASKGFVDTINSETFGATMPRTDWETVGHQPLPLPPVTTQRRIARFLNEKTTRIDGLIEKKRELLDRLAEKRQALITSGVTKGLNPDAPRRNRLDAELAGGMKCESGSLRYFGRIKNGTTPPSGKSDYWDGDVLWATPEDLGKLTTDRIFRTKRKVTRKAVTERNLAVLPVGSVMISTRAPIGHMAINEKPMTFNQGCRGIVPGDSVDGSYLYYLLKSRSPGLNAMANGTTFVELSRDELASVPVAFPPLDTQRRIVRYLDKKTARFEAAAEQILRSIDLLSEYRSALVTAAVTGQCADLR